jgi:polyisoprenoid-binding protein YceI
MAYRPPVRYNRSVVDEPLWKRQKEKEDRTMKFKHFLAIAFAATLMSAPLAPSAQAQTSTWTIDPAHSQVDFQIRHLGVSNVRGSISGAKGTVLLDEKDITKSKVEATLQTATVNTGNEGRDKHLKSPDFFDVDKYPTITFKSTSLSKASGKLQMTGDLTLNGVTKSITLDTDGPAPPQKGMGGKIVSGFSATGILKRSDYNFGAKYGEPALGDEVKFTIDVEIGKQ